MCAIFGTKTAHFSWKKFFGTKHCYYFHLHIGPFHCAKLKKFLRLIQNYDDAPFLGPKWSICPKQFFFLLEIYYHHSHLPISPFHYVKFKKDSSSRVMSMCNLWVQNGPFPQIRIFLENLLMSLVSFIHAYLHARNQSQILIY